MANKRVVFEVSDECLNRLQSQTGITDQTLLNQHLKDVIYASVGLEPEISLRMQKKLDAIEARKARIEMIYDELEIEKEDDDQDEDDLFSDFD